MAKPDNFFKPNENLLRKLSIYVRYYRRENNISQKELAYICNLHPKYIQTLETKTRNVSISTFVQLARGMRLRADVLLGRLI
jgi:transcriptional regulator with XRE-family HTH domain